MLAWCRRISWQGVRSGGGDLQIPFQQRFCGSAHRCFKLETGLGMSQGLSCPTTL